MLKKQTNFKYKKKFKLLNIILLIQSKIIPLILKQELKITFTFKKYNKTDTIIKYLHYSSK